MHPAEIPDLNYTFIIHTLYVGPIDGNANLLLTGAIIYSIMNILFGNVDVNARVSVSL